MKFTGKSVMITGGAGGIGRVVAERFLAEGASVIIADRNGDASRAIVSELGGGATHVELDVTSEASWATAMAQVEAKHAPLCALINIAGIFKPGIPFADLSLDIWREHFAVNLDGAFLGCRHGIAAMKETGGAIVNFSSGLAEIILTDGAAYCVSKAGVVALTRVAAKAGAKHKVRVNAVLPGAIETDMMWSNLRDGMTRQDLIDLLVPQHPIGRLGKPLDVANAVLFLCDPASEFITGVSLPVDGGQLLR